LVSAEQILDEIIPVARRELGSDHQNTTSAIVQRANLENARGNHAAALNALVEVLDARLLKYGPTNRDVLTTRIEMAKTYSLLGRYDDAVQHFDDVLALQAEEIGHNHPDRLDALLDYGDVQLARGNSQRAEALYREAVNAFRDQLGVDDPQTVRAASYLEKLTAPRP
ncbi:MAG: tetratricopeptide repeat protein, partial [Pseudomonadota bacterium]